VVLQRFGQMLFVMTGISILVFLIFFATPGADPAARIAGRNATPQVLAAVRHDFGFDRPLPVQYILMMKRLFITRDLASFVNRGQAVIPEIVDATPVTLSLVLGAAAVCGDARHAGGPRADAAGPDRHFHAGVLGG
jgi:peptide/nickel transport system permease protein